MAQGRYRSTETLHIELDNATFHDRPEVLEYAARDRIKFHFTPTRASWLNRIECHFAALKTFTPDNTDYASHPKCSMPSAAISAGATATGESVPEVEKLIECIPHQPKTQFRKAA